VNLDDCICSGKSLARLLRPAVLALLARHDAHGYVLVQRLGDLALFAEAPPDASGIYKVLKAMEDEGLVTATWEMGESGPAKRKYTLTGDGRACLARWARTLEDYRRQVDGLLQLLNEHP